MNSKKLLPLLRSGCPIVLLLILMFSFCAITKNQELTFSIPVKILDLDNSGNPEMRIDQNGNIYMVWWHLKSGQSTDEEIYFSRSTDDGLNWNPVKNITNTPNIQETLPLLALDENGNISAAWENTLGANRNIHFRRSTNQGDNWNPVVNVSNTFANSSYPHICVGSDGNIYIVWIDRTPGNDDIFFSRSSNNGISWTPYKNLSNNSGGSRHPRICPDNFGNLYVVWGDQTGDPNNQTKIWLKYSTNEGATWSPTVKVFDESGIQDWLPSLAIDNSGHLYLVWQHGVAGNCKVYFSRSTDNGSNWSAPVEVSISSDAWWPEICLDNENGINVVWSDGPVASKKILFRRSADNGVSFEDITQVSKITGNHGSPSIATNAEGKIFITWSLMDSGISYIYFSRSDYEND